MKLRVRYLISCVCELAVLLGISAFLLSACGGGGGVGVSVNTGGNNGGIVTNTPPSQTGAVSAVFAASGVSQSFFVISRVGNSAGSTASFVQAAGPLSSVYVFAHSGTPAVTQDIAGDANFTIGRWVWGTVTNTSTSAVVDTMDGSLANSSWHYVLGNKLSALPTSGSKVCDSGTFTQPSYVVYGSSSANVAVTTGRNASLSFAASGASVSFTLDTTMGATTRTLNFANTNVGLGLASIGNGFGNGIAGGYVMLGDAGGGAIRINGLYSNYQNAGFSYYGTFSFLCQ